MSGRHSVFSVWYRSVAAGICILLGFEKEPDPSFGFVNPVFQKTGGCHILVFVADFMCVTHETQKFQIVFSQFI